MLRDRFSPGLRARLDDSSGRAGQMSDIENDWQFQKTVYWHGDPLPGSDARKRYYADLFFCRKTLERTLRNRFAMGDSYQKPIDGSAPVPDDLLSMTK